MSGRSLTTATAAAVNIMSFQTFPFILFSFRIQRPSKQTFPGLAL